MGQAFLAPVQYCRARSSLRFYPICYANKKQCDTDFPMCTAWWLLRAALCSVGESWSVRREVGVRDSLDGHHCSRMTSIARCLYTIFYGE